MCYQPPSVAMIHVNYLLDTTVNTHENAYDIYELSVIKASKHYAKFLVDNIPNPWSPSMDCGSLPVRKRYTATGPPRHIRTSLRTIVDLFKFSEIL